MRKYHRHRKDLGFTLVEVVITLAILALAAGVMLPAMGNLTRADLRRSASMVVGVVRSAFDTAALTGQTHRLVLTPGSGKIEMESTEDSLRFDDKNGAFVTAAQDMQELLTVTTPFGDRGKKDDKEDEPKVDDETQAALDAASSGPLSAMMGINKVAQRSGKSNFVKDGHYELKGAHVQGVWTDGMDHATTEGHAYLYFFPNGYTQSALVYLEDDEKRVYTVKVQPLTGRSEVLDHYVEVPK